MLYQTTVKTVDGNILHILYIDRDFNKPAAVVYDHDFKRFIIEAIQQDPDLKSHIKTVIDKL